TGLRGLVGVELFGLDYRFAEKFWDEWQAKFHALENNPDPDIARALQTKRIQLTVAPHTPYTVSPQLWFKAMEWAKERGLPVLGHLSESPQEFRWIMEGDDEADAFLSVVHHAGVEGELPPTPWQAAGRTPVEHMHHFGLLNG